MTAQFLEFWAQLRTRHLLVVGFSELTGLQGARLLGRMGVPYSVSDLAPPSVVAPRLKDIPTPPQRLFCGPQTVEQLDGVSEILLSPGVPRSIPLLIAARERGIPIWSDFDLLYPLYADKPIAAVSGTDGKTTTTLLLAHLLAPDRRLVVAGNLGTPITARYDALLDCEAVILELSSFMLEDLKQFRATVSTVLNVDEDHIDRYPNLDAYEATKAAIIQHARPSDLFIQNLDDARVSRWGLSGVRRRTFSMNCADADAGCQHGALRVSSAERATTAFLLRGRHHYSNILAAALMAEELGLSAETALDRAATFPGVPHRFQGVGRVATIDLIDDSKATSMQAVRCALQSLEPRPVVLILGGRDKGLDASPLRSQLGHLRAIVGYGEAGQRLLRALDGGQCDYAPAFSDAVALACRLAQPGDAILLSPGCTSFDQHRDYAERGEEFRKVAGAILARSEANPLTPRNPIAEAL